MTKDTKAKLLALEDMIMNELNLEFLGHELTGTLRMTIKPDISENGIAIEIPAPRYSKKIFLERGYIQFTGKGSYASQLDAFGSWYGNHEGYVERCVDRAIKKWMGFYGVQANISRTGD